MKDLGFSSASRFSFDESVVDFDLWLEAKGNERTIGDIGKQPGKGKTWVPKYASVGDILAEYGAAAPEDEAGIDRAEVAALIASIDATHEPEF